MSEKKKPPQHPIKVARTLADRIKEIANYRDVDISEYVSPMLQEQVDRDYEQMLKEKVARLEQEKKRKHSAK